MSILQKETNLSNTKLHFFDFTSMKKSQKFVCVYIKEFIQLKTGHNSLIFT